MTVDGYNVNEPIGKGRFAKVYKHVNTFNGMAFAVKEEARDISTSFI